MVAASSSFMTDARFPEGRKLLALYPVLLFYLSLAWIVLIGFQQGSTPHSAIAEAGAAGNTTSTTVGGGLASSGTSDEKPSARFDVIQW